MKPAPSVLLSFCLSVRPSVTQVLGNGSKDFLDFRHKIRGLLTEESDTAAFSGKTPLIFFISNFMLFLRVFWTFLENAAKDLAENAYLDSTNHYLQLFYW